MNLDWIEYDEGDSSVPRREMIAVSEETGRSVVVRFPADWDLGEALPEGYVVGFECPQQAKP